MFRQTLYRASNATLVSVSPSYARRRFSRELVELSSMPIPIDPFHSIAIYVMCPAGTCTCLNITIEADKLCFS